MWINEQNTTETLKIRAFCKCVQSLSILYNGLILPSISEILIKTPITTLHRENCDLGEMLRECTAALYTDFEEHKIALRAQIPETPAPYSMVVLNRDYGHGYTKAFQIILDDED